MAINTGIEVCGPAWMWRGKLFNSTSRRQQPLHLSGAAPKHGCATHPALMEQAGSVGWHQDEALQVLGGGVLRVLLHWSLVSHTVFFAVPGGSWLATGAVATGVLAGLVADQEDMCSLCHRSCTTLGG